MSEALQNLDDSRVISRHMKIILLLSCIVSGFISIWSYYADPIINNDGIDYVRAAAALVEGDFDKAKEHYKWLFYPALMAVTHSIFGVSYYIAAVIINALSNIIAVSFFILLLRLFKANTAALIIGALVMVSFPGLNEIRSYLVRDHGYIAFYLMSLYFFCQYWLKNSSNQADSNSPQTVINRYYFYSVLAAVMAFLFRIEGMIFALIIIISPLIINFKQHRYFRPFAILAMSILVVMVVSVYGIWLYTPIEGANYSKLSLGAVTTGWQQLMDNLSLQIERLEIDIIKTSSGDIGRFMYVWIAFGLVISHVLSLLTLIYSVFLIYGWRKKISFPNQSLVPAWLAFILANLAILLFFSLTQLFLTDRYPLAMAVTWMLYVVFVLAFAWNRWRQAILVTTKKRVRYMGYFVLLLLTVNAFQGLTSIPKRKHCQKLHKSLMT
jgi:hypothetical protein